MSVPLLECVPNFSEGRNRATIEAIVEAIASTPNVILCGWEMDADHNRSVVTFAGPPNAIVEGAVCGAMKAAELIDISKHQGVHPRVGATDVIPFIPLGDASMDVAVKAAERAAELIWDQCGVPTYLYGNAARQPSRKRLEKVRRQGFDGLPPDFGTIASHPTAGASVVGARDFLVAYNIDLVTADLAIADSIAKRIRASSGGFPYVKAIGLYLDSRGRAQVSMNLTNYTEIPFDALYQTVAEEAHKAGTEIAESEIIGLIPQAAFDRAPEFFRRIANFNMETRILETQIARQS